MVHREMLVRTDASTQLGCEANSNAGLRPLASCGVVGVSDAFA